MVRLPRLVVAAPSTGQGKTTIATGLMAALRSAGAGPDGGSLSVSGHKVGPDYIDPGYHTLATGRPGRNLDPHLVGEERIVPLLLHGATTPDRADLAVIEGVMGLHDGRLGTDGFASTAHVARLTSTPVLLVLDVARLSRSAGAIAAGMATFDQRVRIGGVVLNRAGSARNVAEITRAMERAGLPVLGALPADERLAAPSRHLGLVPAAEREESQRLVLRLGEQVARHLDLGVILELARSAPPLDDAAWDPRAEVGAPVPGRPVVAVAGGRAFTFRYPETDELLTAAGCEVVTFDPLTDRRLPAGTRGIYLGGGFPEVYAAELAANRPLLADLAAAVAAGVPTVAECAGLLYLAETLDGAAMSAVVPARAAMTDRLTLRYPVATAVGDSLLTVAGERVTGHEFHRTATTPAYGPGGAPGSAGHEGRQGAIGPAWQVDGDMVGFAGPTLHASYLHVHWAGHPQLARRFAEAVHSASVASGAPSRYRVGEPAAVPSPPEPVGAAALGDPLRHHGDAETAVGMLDFAVNVVDQPRPRWLDRALHAAVDAAAAYPSAEPARAALAQRHGRRLEEVLPTAGAAEAFTLLARLRQWQCPVVVHPQFTEPHAALEQAGHAVTVVLTRREDGFALDPAAIPDDADLVVVGNPTNPTGVLHPASALRRLLRPGRLVVVDEAFMDVVPGETESLIRERRRGLVVIRSLTKHWSIPGIRAGYVVGHAAVVRRLAAAQTPWSVSGPAVAATLACTTKQATVEARQRAEALGRWRACLQAGLTVRGIEQIPSQASFVLARLGESTRIRLRDERIAVRRADTFPGLDASWSRIAVRPPRTTAGLLAALDRIHDLHPVP